MQPRLDQNQCVCVERTVPRASAYDDARAYTLDLWLGYYSTIDGISN